MRWPVLLIGGVLISSVIIFALTSGNGENSMTLAPLQVTSSSAGAFFGTTTPRLNTHEGGVHGRVQVKCIQTDTENPCLQHSWTIQAYQGIASVGLFKTNTEGEFLATLPPGQYELRVDSATTTRCASVGIVVPEDGYISTSLTCEVGGSI